MNEQGQIISGVWTPVEHSKYWPQIAWMGPALGWGTGEGGAGEGWRGGEGRGGGVPTVPAPEQISCSKTFSTSYRERLSRVSGGTMGRGQL